MAVVATTTWTWRPQTMATAWWSSADAAVRTAEERAKRPRRGSRVPRSGAVERRPAYAPREMGSVAVRERR
ncbi:hypothetical protein BHE74_00057991 [Ensete ventricosum]|nr:hypothetical protein BHE74_00057991 [Ensete ventricosum]